MHVDKKTKKAFQFNLKIFEFKKRAIDGRCASVFIMVKSNTLAGIWGALIEVFIEVNTEVTVE